MDNVANITQQEVEKANRESLLNELLNERCDMYGTRNTICYLFDFGLTRDEIIHLDFDETDVDYVEAHPDETYDCV